MICDANVVLRYLLEDIPDLTARATDLLEREDIFLPFEVIAEVVYVLEKIYGVNRTELSRNLLELLTYPNITTVDTRILDAALRIFSSSRLDFVDTLLCGYAQAWGEEIETFDIKLRNRLMKGRTRS